MMLLASARILHKATVQRLQVRMLIMTDIARNSLMEIMIDMNGSLIEVIRGLLTSDQVLFSSSEYNAWNVVGARTTNATVNTLAQLYQRKLQSAPVPRTMTVESLDGESDDEPVDDSSPDDESSEDEDSDLNDGDSDDEGLQKINEKFSDGCSYRGHVKDGLYHGSGKLKLPKGEHYEGAFANGLRNGRGKYIWENGETYEGHWLDGDRHGYGIQQSPDGDRYEGHFVNGKRTGRGKMVWSNGDRYEGEWDDNLGSGYGTFRWPNGSKYEGYWRGGQKYGKGVKTFSNGELYDGEWKDNLYGEGEIIYVNGTKARGTWLDREAVEICGTEL